MVNSYYLEGGCRGLSQGANPVFTWRELPKTTKTFSWNRRYSRRDMNRLPLEYKSRELPLCLPARFNAYRYVVITYVYK